MAKQEEEDEKKKEKWGTWEELLLASAVKRHGFKNWDSVALEIRTKSSLHHLLTTAENCQQKYHDLHRRFTVNHNDNRHNHNPQEQKDQENNVKSRILGDDTTTDSNINAVNIPWLEELRELRVAELKREVQRYDVSILTLQLKVKKLVEECEGSVQGDSNTEKPDLRKERSENNEPHELGQPVSVSGEESDRDNRSVNESNSTGSGGKVGGEDAVLKPEEMEPVRTGSDGPDPVMSGSNREEEDGGRRGGEDSWELGDSVTQSSGESLSSGRKRKRTAGERKEVSETGGDERVAVGSVKSEPSVGFLGTIRAHKNGSLFESLLKSQEMDVYKEVIRQHMDLEAIQRKLEQGSYSSSNLSFYRDLLLLFNNVIVSFPKISVESLTAHELRSRVLCEIRKDTQKSDSTVMPPNLPPEPKSELQRSDSLLAKHTSSIPVIVCRKRSSMSAKPSSSSLGQKIEQQQQQPQQINENKPVSDPNSPIAEQGLLKVKSEEKPVTGARSSRRGKKHLAKDSSPPTKKQNTSPGAKVVAPDKSDTPKTEKKKTEALPVEKKKTEALPEKKKNAVDFLKRIKKNSPAETSKKNSPAETSKKNSKGTINAGGERKTGGNAKGEKGKERVLRNSSDRKQGKQENSPAKRNIGRPSKQAVEVSRVSGKRGRDSGGKEVTKTPRKRTRR